jgi:hypothetical protein
MTTPAPRKRTPRPKNAPAKKTATVVEPAAPVQVEEEVIPTEEIAVPAVVTPSADPKVLPPRLYDFLKLNALLILPALSAFYLTIAQVWGLPGTEKVVTTIAAVNVLVGLLVKKSQSNFDKSDAKFDGSFDVTEDDIGDKNFLLNLNEHPELLAGKDQIVFKVNKTS